MSDSRSFPETVSRIGPPDGSKVPSNPKPQPQPTSGKV